MNNYFIILAAGKGVRFSHNKPKQYFNYKGKILIHHSIDKAIKSKLFKKIIVVASKKYKKEFNKYNKNQLIFQHKRPFYRMYDNISSGNKMRAAGGNYECL